MTATPGDRRLARLAVLAALGAVLQVAESLLPHPVPGVRLGLANLATLLALVELGPAAAVGVAVLRSLVSSLVLGTFLGPGFVLSLGGGVASALVMGLLYALTRRSGFRLFGLVGVSVAGAAAHALAQVTLVYLLFVTSRGVWLLWPWLALSAVATGIINGLVAGQALGQTRSQRSEGRSRGEKYEPGGETGPGRFEPGESFLHLAPAALKVGVAVALALSVVLVPRFELQAGAAGLLLALTLVARARAGRLLRGLARLGFLLLLALAMPVLFTPWGEVLLRAGPLTVTADGLRAGVLFAGRIALLYWTFALLGAVTRPEALNRGLVFWLEPLRLFRVQTEDLARALGIAWDAFPVLWQDARRLARGRGPDGKRAALVRLPADILVNLRALADRLADEATGS